MVFAPRLSAAATVLLKNDNNVLPLPKDKTLALIGFATEGAVVHGGGSGSVVPSYVVSPMEGIVGQAGAGATVLFDDGTDLDSAAALAAKSDYAVVFVGGCRSHSLLHNITHHYQLMIGVLPCRHFIA